MANACRNCGYRNCMCHDPRAAQPGRGQTSPGPSPSPVDDEEEESEDYLEYLAEQFNGSWGKEEIKSVVRELVRRVRRLEQKDLPPPGTHIIKGPPRS